MVRRPELAVADIEIEDGEVWLRLGAGEPVPIISPFSDLLLAHIATRSNRTTATNRDSTLLRPA